MAAGKVLKVQDPNDRRQFTYYPAESLVEGPKYIPARVGVNEPEVKIEEIQPPTTLQTQTRLKKSEILEAMARMKANGHNTKSPDPGQPKSNGNGGVA